VNLVVVAGNHDRGLLSSTRALPFAANGLPSSWTIADWTVSHGHRAPAGSRTISGHHHPVLRCGGVPAPCFLVGPGRIVLPAFSTNAAGCDVVSASVPTDWRGNRLRCIASTGSELLDFGPLPDLRRRVRGRVR
jgi:metallophosphoesterase superfamily enzyme